MIDAQAKPASKTAAAAAGKAAGKKKGAKKAAKPTTNALDKVTDAPAAVDDGADLNPDFVFDADPIDMPSWSVNYQLHQPSEVRGRHALH